MVDMIIMLRPDFEDQARKIRRMDEKRRKLQLKMLWEFVRTNSEGKQLGKVSIEEEERKKKLEDDKEADKKKRSEEERLEKKVGDELKRIPGSLELTSDMPTCDPSRQFMLWKHSTSGRCHKIGPLATEIWNRSFIEAEKAHRLFVRATTLDKHAIKPEVPIFAEAEKTLVTTLAKLVLETLPKQQQEGLRLSLKTSLAEVLFEMMEEAQYGTQEEEESIRSALRQPVAGKSPGEIWRKAEEWRWVQARAAELGLMALDEKEEWKVVQGLYKPLRLDPQFSWELKGLVQDRKLNTEPTTSNVGYWYTVMNGESKRQEAKEAKETKEKKEKKEPVPPQAKQSIVDTKG